MVHRRMILKEIVLKIIVIFERPLKNHFFAILKKRKKVNKFGLKMLACLMLACICTFLYNPIHGTQKNDFERRS